ncbi:WecB/TagA/CpsF family glycosyltransferase [Fluviicola taffensis]|uniref:WecB/TagA/CpsF family glycosyltransferase n=1 Tax=Fluviicola taffensis TaxID=191579 RepID=UPI003137CE07
MESRLTNNVRCFAPASRKELMDYAFEQRSILVAVNAEKILHATEQSRAIINRNIGYPDGIGAVWALKKKGCNPVEKIPGCELWLDIVKEYHPTKSFYLLGGTNEVIQETVDRLRKEFPGINILSYKNGYLSDDERKDLILDIAEKKPDIIFVAMGSPKQELLMEEMYRHHPAVYQGLGGSFDVYTNKVKRAPKWWVKNNLEWAYRLVKQPSRIKRQIHLIRFFVLLQFNRL